uniref:Uncharacterized protein n=1 Tax=Oryza meridionalis TaxID=40149 RepID=A0A0E0F3A7_9ORYZ
MPSPVKTEESRTATLSSPLVATRHSFRLLAAASRPSPAVIELLVSGPMPPPSRRRAQHRSVASYIDELIDGWIRLRWIDLLAGDATGQIRGGILHEFMTPGFRKVVCAVL